MTRNSTPESQFEDGKHTNMTKLQFPRAHTAALSLGLVLALAVPIACSSDSGTTSSTAVSSAPGTTAAPTVPKAQIIERGDQICTVENRRNSELPEPKDAAGIEPYFTQSITILRGEFDQIQALGTPDRDADKLATALAKGRAALDAIEARVPEYVKNPSSIADDTQTKDLLEESRVAAQEFGFKVCGANESSGRGSTTSTR